MLGFSVFEPDGDDLDLAGVEAARRDQEADLGAVKGDGQVGVDRRARDLAGGGVHPRRDIDRDDGHAGGVDLLDLTRRLRPGLALEAGAEEGVDDDVCVRRDVFSRLDDLGPEQPGRDPPVAAVRPLAADRDDAGAGIVVGDRRGNRTAGSVHQLGNRVGIPRIALFRRAHLLRGVERLKHPVATPRKSRRRARASASSSTGEPMVPP